MLEFGFSFANKLGWLKVTQDPRQCGYKLLYWGPSWGRASLIATPRAEGDGFLLA